MEYRKGGMLEYWNTGMVGYPGPSEIGFVLHISPSAAPRRQAKLGSFCTIGRPATDLCPIRNPKSAIEKLASFRTFHVAVTVRPGTVQIGFVSRVSPRAAARCQARLASFCTFHPPGPRPCRGPGQIGFVLHNQSPGEPPDPAGPRPFPCASQQLALFCTLAPPRNWLRFAQSPPDSRRASPNWLCLTRRQKSGPTDAILDLGAGTRVEIGFGDFCRGRLVSHESSPPRHRGHGVGASPSPAMNWGLSL